MTSEVQGPRKFGLLRVRWLAEKAAEEAERQKKRHEREQRIAHHRTEILHAAEGHDAEMLGSVEATRERLSHAHGAVRRAALYLIENHWKPVDEDTRESVLRLVNDPDPDVRTAAIRCVGHEPWKGSKDPEAARILAEIVADEAEDVEVRQTAYTSLRRVMGLNLFRWGLPVSVKFRDEVDWDLLDACLHAREFSIAHEADLPFDEWLERITPCETQIAFREMARGDEAFDAGDYAIAIARYSEALSQRSYAVGARYMRGCAFGNLGELDQAIADFNAVIERKSNEPVYYRERSEAYRRKGLVDLAEADERTAIELESR